MFSAARFTLRQPKTPMSNAMNLRTFCFVPFKRLCPVTLAHEIFLLYSILYFYTSDTFPFTNFTLQQIFPDSVYTTRNIFLFPDDAVTRNLIIIFNFSSQRPNLNYIFLSNVYSFDAMEFSMKHKY